MFMFIIFFLVLQLMIILIVDESADYFLRESIDCLKKKPQK